MATLTLKKNGAPADRNPDRKPVRSAAGVKRPTLAKANEDRARREERFGGPRRFDGPPGREGGDRPSYGGDRGPGGGGFGAGRPPGRPGGNFGGGGGGGGGGYPRGPGGDRRDSWQGDRGPRPESQQHHADRPQGDRLHESRGPRRDDDQRAPMNRGAPDRAPAWGERGRDERQGSAPEGRDNGPRGDPRGGGGQWGGGAQREERGNFNRPDGGGYARPAYGARDERAPQGPRPGGDRPYGDRPPYGERPRGDFRPQGDRPFNDRGGPGGFDRDGPRRPDERFRDPRDERRPGPPRDFAPRGGPHGQAPGGRDDPRPPYREGGRDGGGGFDPRRDPRGPDQGGGPRGNFQRQDGPRGDFRPPRRDDRGAGDFDGGPRPRDDQRPYPGERPRADFRRDNGPDNRQGDRRDARPAQRGDWPDRNSGPRDEHRYAPVRHDQHQAPQGGEQAGSGDDHEAGGGADPQREARVWRGQDNTPVSQAPRSVPARQAAEGSGERLSKRLGQLGMASRREADDWIDAGWVRVDGKVAHLGQRVGPDVKIEVDPIAKKQQAQRVTILIHKPVGYVSGQAEDGYEPASVLITAENRWATDPSGTKFHAGQLRGLAPAGRLDIDSTGLLVLTQDGRVARTLIANELPDQPGAKAIEKEYLVRVAFEGDDLDPKSRFPAESLALLEHGLTLDEVELQPAKVSWQNEDQLRFVLREGRKRQIRRMCEAVGLVVMGLKRVRIGRITLGALPPGQWRYLAPWEHFE